MKNTNDIGKVYRYLPEYNYRALWEDNKTIRFMLEGRLTDPIRRIKVNSMTLE